MNNNHHTSTTNVDISTNSSKLIILIRATQVRAYDDRAIGSFVRNSYVSTLCTVVLCPDLCTSELLFTMLVLITTTREATAGRADGLSNVANNMCV